jgi:hypothetical protein
VADKQNLEDSTNRMAGVGIGLIVAILMITSDKFIDRHTTTDKVATVCYHG